MSTWEYLRVSLKGYNPYSLEVHPKEMRSPVGGSVGPRFGRMTDYSCIAMRGPAPEEWPTIRELSARICRLEKAASRLTWVSVAERMYTIGKLRTILRSQNPQGENPCARDELIEESS